MTRCLIIMLCPLVICACKKEKEPVTNIPPTDTSAAYTYNITSADNIELRNNISDTTFMININKLDKEQASVTLSPAFIPQYTHLKLSSSTGTAPFEIDANIQSVFATPGFYNMVIAAAAGLKEKNTHS